MEPLNGNPRLEPRLHATEPVMLVFREAALLQPARGGAPRRAGPHAIARPDAGPAPEGAGAALLVAARQFADPRRATWALIRFDESARLDSAGVRAGVHGLQFHGAAARGPAPHRLRPPPRRSPSGALGLLYAMPSGISASQFTRWHLDHHAELGSDEDDPKRHHLSPKRERALVQAAVLHAGAVPDLLPRGAA